MKFPAVDIVVPIFNARKDVVRCVGSVLEHARGNYSLVLVNDKSTDAELVEYLEAAAGRHSQIVLLHAAVNGGFVQTANLGMKHSTAEAKRKGERRDVLLLNSDTVCTPEFLERIQACAYADATTGIVTPFSNNATICSIPKFCQDNPLPADMALDDYARLISQHSLKRRPEIVTAVGFCMYVRSEVIKKVGYFDSAYGRGFGEENDFCEQAKRAGFTIRLCDDVFIAHTGKASFGDEGRMLEHQNTKVLLSRFPSYLDDVSYFCETNPLLEVQANANYFTRRAPAVSKPAVLHVLHANPFHPGVGGSEHYAIDLMRAMRLPRAVVASPASGGITFSEVLNGDTDDPIHHWFPLKRPVEKICYEHEELCALLARLVPQFGIRAAHIHHFFSWPVSIWRVFAEARVPYLFMLHDYLAVCPSHNLFDFSAMSNCPCALGEETTECCLQAYSRTSHTELPGTSAAAVRAHRGVFGQMLEHAHAVVAPSRKTLSLVEERAGVKFNGLVVPHGYDAPAAGGPQPTSYQGTLKIGVLGNVNYPNKGRAYYQEVVAKTREADVEWHFFGDVSAFGFEQELALAGNKDRLHFHGAYSRGEIIPLLREHGIRLVVLLPACHETFSFTLSEALLAGVPVLALAMGSLVERLNDAQLSVCLCQSPAQVVERLLYYAGCRPELERLAEQVRSFRHPSRSECVSRIQALYEHAGVRPFDDVPAPSAAQQRETFHAHLQLLRPAAQEPIPFLRIDEYAPAWWRPMAVRLGRVVRGIDSALKEQYLRRRIDIIRSFPFHTLGKLCALSPDTQLLPDHGRAAAFRATGRDPFLVLPEGRVPTGEVDCLRLRIRCDVEHIARAQLFWTHGEDEAFSEEKSLRIPLKRTAAWQDLVLDLRAWHSKDTWTAGPEVFKLRLDPLDCEGYFELQDLTFAKVSA